MFRYYKLSYCAIFFVSATVGLCDGALLIPKSVAPWPTDSASPNVSAVVDGNWNNQWTAWPCRAGGWRGNSVLNVMLNACARGYCSESCSMVQDSKLASATDNSGYTGGFIPISHGDGKAWVIFPFQNGPKTVTKFFVRGIWPVGTVFEAITEAGERKEIALLGPELSYLELEYPGLAVPVAQLRIRAASKDGVMRGFCYAGVGDCKSFVVTEIAAQLADCYEQISLDFGSAVVLQKLETTFSGAVNATLATSLDGLTYQNVVVLVGSLAGVRSVSMPNVTARYARMRFITRFTSPADAWQKVRVNEIQFSGHPAPVPLVCPNNCSAHGVCDPARACVCDDSFVGDDCSSIKCSPLCVNGRCIEGKCDCDAGFRGAACDTPFCPNDCWNHGTCMAGQCKCFNGWTGSDCRYYFFNGSDAVASTPGVLLLDYNQRIDNISATIPPAVTSFYYHRFLSNGCNNSFPFVCADGSCESSNGRCSLRARKEAANWSAPPFLSQPLTTKNGTRVTTSSNQQNSMKVIDGNDGAGGFWQSGQCYPLGYVQNSLLNILLGSCTAGRCQSTASSSVSLSAATDGNTNTATGIPVSSGIARLVFNLSKPSSLAAVSIRLGAPDVGVSVVGVTAASQRVLLGNVSVSFSHVNVDLSNVPIFISLQLESSKPFSVFEMSARDSPCFEHATVDLGRESLISALTIRHWAGSDAVNYTLYESSLDGVVWTLLRDPVPPQLLASLDTELNPAIKSRYVRVRHVLKERMSVRVYVWEVTVWDEWGKYGRAIAPDKNSVNFRDLLGVNGIWSWGGAGWSNLARTGWGPKRFSGMSSHARNYHNWNWDVDDPNQTPNFEMMACGKGTDSNWWLSWDWEYSGWNAAGLEVDACIQFTAEMFAQSRFKNPYRAAYNYGYAFAKHFGKTYGVGLVTHIEVGNEPWIVGIGYPDPVFYSEILLGMARGIKDADPTMRVLPAVFSNNDVPARVNETHLQYLDGFNVHAYSYAHTVRGRTGVHPEHNMSSLHDVDWMLRFRDANAPGLPVYLTEWGWDSDGGGEGCGPPPERAGDTPFPECVSEGSQALYAVRGALVLARKGLARLTWYFYGNQEISTQTWDKIKGLFGRSGLVSSRSAGFQSKRALYALEVFVSTLGHTHFMGVLREDAEAFVYLLGDGNSTVTHVVAWRPVDGEDYNSSLISFTLSGQPVKAWQLGLGSYVAAPFPQVSGTTWQMQVSGTPTVVGLSSALWLPCMQSCLNGGLCHNGTCFCFDGFTGPSCVSVRCENDCWQRGSCQPNGTCQCDTYWSGSGAGEYQRCYPENFLSEGNCRDAPVRFDSHSNCSIVACKDDCNGHGRCSSSGCICEIGWAGASCDQPPCPFNCRSHGVCKNGTCFCRDGFIGSSCEWNNSAACPQREACSISKPFFCDGNATCVSAVGECVLQKSSTKVRDWSAAKYHIQPLTAGDEVWVITSSSQQSATKVIDGNDGAGGFWQSGQCYPLGYVQYRLSNVLLNSCLAGRCQSTAPSSVNLAAATDGDVTTSVDIPVSSGISRLVLNMTEQSSLVAISLKISFTDSVINVIGLTASSQRVSLVNLTVSSSHVNVDLSNVPSLALLQLESSKPFSVFEMSARDSPCSEYATVDLGRESLISALTIRHWAGSDAVNYTLYESSLDGVVWTLLRDPVPPQLLASLDTELNPAIKSRYVRVRHVLKERMSVRVYVWEVTVWDEWGKYGRRSPAIANTASFRDLLGVNGIWGWGTDSFSSTSNGSYGPLRFIGMSSHARNYHNWNWDVSDPDSPPPFDEMVARGSVDWGVIPGHASKLAQDWLNWDYEYTAWKKAGLQVQVCIQFTAEMFPQNVFNDPYSAGYKYGYAFARHFGPTRGTGDVCTVEVGNEPWIVGIGYPDPVFYSEILLGMARGIKDADPTMRVLPAVFSNNDVPARVNETHLQYLDGFNVHAYSYAHTVRGRTGVHPEHNMSSLHDVDWMLRFRDANAPGLPVYLTEWGWDSDGGGEGCGPPPERAGDTPFPECVSEGSQALYAVRGALVLARKGLARLTWYFYGNQEISTQTWDKIKGLFGRSGLVSSRSAGFQSKRALYALEVFVSTLGHTHFMGVLREDAEAFVYLLGDGNSTVTHVVAWRPVDGEDYNSSLISFTLSGQPVKAWQLGLGSYVAAPLPQVSGTTWQMQVSGTPCALEITPLLASRFTVAFIVTLPMAVSDFAAGKADYIAAVASVAGVPSQAIEIVSLEPAAGAGGAVGVRRLLMMGVDVGTEIVVDSKSKAEWLAVALTAESLGSPLAQRRLPQPTSFLSTPRVVVGAFLVRVAEPANSSSETCKLERSWEDLIAIKVAERRAACSSNASKQGDCLETVVTGGLGQGILEGVYEVNLKEKCCRNRLPA